MTDEQDFSVAEPDGQDDLTRKGFIAVGAAGAGLLGLPAAEALAGKGRRASRLRKRRLAVVREHMESENAQQFDITMETFDHPRYEIIPTGDVYDGPEEVAGYYRETRSAFPDQRNEGAVFWHTDEGVVTEFYLLGTMKGAIRGFPPTGRSFRVRMTAYFIFAPKGDGIIIERIYFDLYTFLRQIGLLEAAALTGREFPADGGIPIEEDR